MPDELTAGIIGVTKIFLLQKPPRGMKFYEPTELTDKLNLVVGLIQDGTEIRPLPCLRPYPSRYRADSGISPVRNVHRRAHQNGGLFSKDFLTSFENSPLFH